MPAQNFSAPTPACQPDFALRDHPCSEHGSDSRFYVAAMAISLLFLVWRLLWTDSAWNASVGSVVVAGILAGGLIGRLWPMLLTFAFPFLVVALSAIGNIRTRPVASFALGDLYRAQQSGRQIQT